MFFLSYIMISTQDGCVKFNYSDQPDDLSQMKPGVSIQLTTAGLYNYFIKNELFSMEYITQAIFNDVYFNISGFRIKMTDIHIANIAFPTIQMQLTNQHAILQLNNASLELQAQFSVLQETYPYIQDSGSAQILVNGFRIFGLLGITLDQECPLHYILVPSNVTTNLDSINVQFSGKFAIIYNSIMQSLTNMFMEKFNDLLGQNIVYTLFDVGNSFLKKDVSYVCNPQFTTSIGTDQRVSYVNVDPEFLTVYTLGQTMMADTDPNVNETAEIYGYVAYNFSEVPNYITNDNVQYKYHYLVFQSNFDKMLQRKLINQQLDELQVSDIKLNGFTNIGVLADIYVKNHSKSSNNTDNNQFDYVLQSWMQFQADPEFYVNEQVNQTLIFVQDINIMQVKSVNETNINIDASAFDEVLDRIINATKMYGVQITNSNYVRQCNMITIDEEWIHVGCSVPLNEAETSVSK